MSMTTLDAIIIGSGQGGVPLAKALAESGRKTAIIERKLLGGSCINYGCTPTKTLYNSARIAYLTRRSSDFGVSSRDVAIDAVAVHKRVSDMVLSFREGLERELSQVRNLRVVKGHARLTGPGVVRIDSTGEEFIAPWIFLNTGTRPLVPTIPGLDSTRFIDNGGILDLTRLPQSLLVLGGGYIGLEFAQIYQRLGSTVTVVGHGECLLEREDSDLSEAVLDVLREDGVDVVLGDPVQRVTAYSSEFQLHLESGRALPGSDLLVATGRRPNTDDLGLDKAHIETDERGYVKVDDRLQTTADGVFAIGDVKGGPQFTHISYDDFRILYGNLLSGASRTTRNRTVPYVIYLDPQLGRIGPTEADLRNQGTAFRAAKLAAKHIARAVEMDETRGFVKVLVDSKSDRILSATTFCVEGGELLATLQLAIQNRIPYTALRDGVFAHPTIAECLNNLFSSL